MRALLGLLAAAASGVLFGIGLAIARMTDPEKIRDFLDVTAIPAGGWDPSLAFVMGGAAIVAFFGLRLDRSMAQPFAAAAFSAPAPAGIDRSLLAGSALFGVGWGVSGFCPGPAIANLGIVPGSVIGFVVAMLVGSWAAGAAIRANIGRTAPAA
jgi:uncharacterized membrane protein YedE/YeeE